MARLTIIDGNSLLFRAYFATAYPGVEIMRSQDGTPTNAIFAFSNMMNKIIANLKENEGIIVAFDAAKHNFRHDALETYKANRKPAPEDLVTQFPIARDFLKSFGIFQFEEEGFEGDDIAGTIAKKAEKEGYEVEIYTSDRDFLQLVSEHISVQIIRKGLSDVVKMTPDVVKETYGFSPIQIIDYKGLRGDSSDNLPGIPGIGEKTAVKLIEEYGNFDNIIAHSSEIKGKVGEAITQNAEIGRISRDLAIIKTDVKLPFTIEDTIYHGYSFKVINEFCQKYGLKQFLSKVSPKWKMLGEESANIEVQKVSSFKGINLGNEIGIALDYKDEEDYFNSEIFGISLSSKSEHYYISIEDAKNDKELLDILSNKDIKKYCYDYKAIKVALAKYNIAIEGLEFDLLIATYLIDTTIKSKVEPVLNVYGVDISSKSDEVSLLTSDNPDRTAKIAYYSLTLFGRAKAELVKFNALDLYNSLELPLVDVLAKMEIEGFPLDLKVLDSFGDEWKIILKKLEDEIYDLAGEKFNISSPKQLGEVLFEHLSLPSPKKNERGYKTDVKVLTKLVDSHPIIPKILEYRNATKLYSTYLEGMENYVMEDGKIHTIFKQNLARTGRLSSTEPNLQNIPVRDSEGKKIRKAFYPENDLFLSADYSQIELRILAHISGSKELQEAFINGQDIHTKVAADIHGIKESEVTKQMRSTAKAVIFGIVYGISGFGLGENLSISPKEAKAFIDKYYELYPGVKRYMDEIVNEAKEQGAVRTLWKRRRVIPELSSPQFMVRQMGERIALNTPIQGTCADIIKKAMVDIEKVLERKQMKSKMVLQIHDELIFDCVKSEKEELVSIVQDIMTHIIELDVPLKVSADFGEDLYETK